MVIAPDPPTTPTLIMRWCCLILVVLAGIALVLNHLNRPWKEVRSGYFSRTAYHKELGYIRLETSRTFYPGSSTPPSIMERVVRRCDRQVAGQYAGNVPWESWETNSRDYQELSHLTCDQRVERDVLPKWWIPLFADSPLRP